MAEETAVLPAETEQMEEVSAPSTSAEKDKGDDTDVDCEAKKLMAHGARCLVLKDIRSAVNAFQEASSLLGKKYGETAPQCAEAFFGYGKCLLELARVETTVLGNALEGMPEEEDDEDEGGKEDPNIPSAANLDEKEREELREQVYDAMAEKKCDKENGEDSKEPKVEPKSEDMECEKPGAPETKDQANGEAKEEKDTAKEEKAAEEAKTEPDASSEAAGEEKDVTEATEKSKTEAEEADSTQGPEEKPEDNTEVKAEGDEASEAAAKSEETATDKKEDQTEGDEAEPMEGGEDEEAESDDNEEKPEKECENEEEEDIDNLQLAWEMLDLSKIIFKRQTDKESQLKAAQAHLKLGEVSIESENYTQAVEDFLACLTIQKEHLEEHDRLLAETHYQLGLAYQYSSKHDSAISHFTQSIEVIEKRLAVLTERLETATEECKEEMQKEMEELKGLLPDIKEKIEDSKEAQKMAEDTDKALKETLGGTSSGFPKENGGTSTSAVPAEKSGDGTVPVTNCVSDISHLVRKKRKPEEESPQKDAKKSKSEPVENGSGNGDAVVPTSEQVEKAEEAENQTPMETAVESSA